MDHTTIAPVPTPAAQAERKAYNTPTLTDFGSFAELTHGFAGTAALDNTIYS
jgi:hypothetical protein